VSDGASQSDLGCINNPAAFRLFLCHLHVPIIHVQDKTGGAPNPNGWAGTARARLGFSWPPLPVAAGAECRAPILFSGLAQPVLHAPNSTPCFTALIYAHPLQADSPSMLPFHSASNPPVPTCR